MSIPEGNNPLTITEDWFAKTLPQLEAFRELCGAETAEEAAEHVFLDETDEVIPVEGCEADGRLERGTIACVSTSPNRPYEISLGPDDLWYPTGNTLIYFETVIPPSESHTDATQDHSRGRIYRVNKNSLGKVMQEMVDRRYELGGPHLSRLSIAAYGENEEGDWQSEGRMIVAVLAIEWGTRA